MPRLPVWLTAIPTLSLGLAALAWVPLPSQAAEDILLDFGPFSRSVPVSSLEQFGATGEADAQLTPLIRRLSPEQRAALRESLTLSKSVNLAWASQWFNTPMGERTLLFLGKFAQTPARLNGQIALRAAITAAVAEDGDISALDLARHFPTRTMRLDTAAILRATQEIQAEARATLAVVDTISEVSQAAAAKPPRPDWSALPDLTQPGPYGYRRMSLVLADQERQRTYPAEIYLPEPLAALPSPVPVVVISHGLGDSPASFLDIAAHLTSHGFVVALPEHIGSSFTQKQAMLNWLSQETFKAQDFLDRPLDVSFLLDELERMNATTFGGQLGLDRVAVVGHSFGGYTALALGGATIDFDRLSQRCDPQANIVLDAAMVLECRALELLDNPSVVQHLGETGTQDERVKLVMAFATVSNLFGPKGMGRVDVPVMFFSGAFDILAPVVPQQVSAFSWLTSPERYLYLAENTSHSPSFTRLISDLLDVDQYLEQSADEALVMTRAINKSLLVAFTKVYVAREKEFEPFLTPAYVEAVSANPFRLHLVRTLPSSIQDLLEPAQP